MPATIVEGMWLMLQQAEPDDYVLATGETHSVREFVERAFAYVGRSIDWRGEGVDEKGVDAKTGKRCVAVDPRYFRPTEVDLLLGDAVQGARRSSAGSPRSPFAELVAEMVESDRTAVDAGDSAQRSLGALSAHRERSME